MQMMLTTEIVDEFLSYRRNERGSPINTIIAYTHELKRFKEYLDRIQCHLNDIKTNTIERFLTELAAKGLAASTRHRALGCLKSFFQFLKREGYIKTDVSKLCPSPKLWQRTPVVLSIEEAKSVVEAPDLDTQFGLRDRAMLELLWGSGLRASEVCDLKVKDVGSGFVRVTGKGNKQRIVPTTRHFEEALKEYWHDCFLIPNEEPDGYVFRSKKKTIRICRTYLFKLVQHYADLAGVKKRVSPHTFRHTFATHLLENGANIRVIQEMLGHEHIITTERYLTVNLAYLTREFSRYHTRYERD